MPIMEAALQWKTLVDRHLALATKPLIVIVGPTASGKTGLSLDIAEYIAHASSGQEEWRSAEVVNADSRQLYKHMDIGTAKIIADEMRGIPHHLISVLDPKEEVTIAWYQERATVVIDDILARKHVPILVGGSMLYLSSIIDSLQPLPSVDPSLRTAIDAEYERDREKLYAELLACDPATAKGFSAANKVHLVRGVELLRMQKEKPSQLKKRGSCGYDLLVLGLRWERDAIVRRIDERTRQMIAAGWIEEVERLLDTGYTAKDPGMKSHGYREIIQWIGSGAEERKELCEVIARKTRQYAKRQMTWWNRDQRIRWIVAS